MSVPAHSLAGDAGDAARSRIVLPLGAEVLGAAVVLGLGLTVVYRLTAAQAARQVQAAPWWIDTPVDRLLPTVPAAVWIYLSWYPVLALLMFAGRPAVRYGCAALAIAFAACTAGHLLLPIHIVRPAIDPTAGVSAAVLAWFYAFDPPYNLFPSFHAAAAAVLAAAPGAARWRRVAVLWAITLCASCVLIRQHYLMDVIVGLVVGLAAAAASRHLSPQSRRVAGSSWSSSERPPP